MILKYPSDEKKIYELFEDFAIDEKIIEAVKKIVLSVKNEGDSAIIEFTERFDKIRLKSIKISEEELQDAYKRIKKGDLTAIKFSIKNITNFHKKGIRKPWKQTKDGKTLGEIVRPIRRVGLYIPGGKFPLISTLLMTAIPAKIAGCSEIAVCSPPPISECILGVCFLLELREVYSIGGAQAIAAFAYGTESVKKVDFIAGPGNIYVTAAKKLVFGDVGIDLLAGPSEVLVIADSFAKQEFVELELLSQLEHGEGTKAILITTSNTLAKKIESKVSQAIIILAKTIDDCCFLSNEFAPEHLCIHTKNPESLLPKIESVGAIFPGQYSAVALGDYIAGPSHVLPTGRSARFFSGLSVSSFQKKISLISYTKEGVLKDKSSIFLAELEGLKRHKKSIKIRI
ncbi:TPA: histidinol dehydrogenase [bacterium]|nr:histidinol dehydrogenase [bacterium]